ncbi:MAG: glycosyltransferase family 4 protein [Phycisphaerales bacterium]|nr:MAG: glycosyltransferase family 4 protein [Phycisphaerales bacterium]
MPTVIGPEQRKVSGEAGSDRERSSDSVTSERDRDPVSPSVMAMVAPLHPNDPDWPWITRIGPMRRFHFTRRYIQNTHHRFPKASRVYRQAQYLGSMRSIRSAAVAFLFSTDVGIGLTRWPSRLFPGPRRVYVGFTQDGRWEPKRIMRVRQALQRCDAITIFTEEERRVYLDRYGLSEGQVRLIPLHTDEVNDYRQYPDQTPIDQPYVVSLGSPNRRFTPVAEVCRERGIRLVVITRPTHVNDSLDDLRRLGATVITDADKLRALTYLKHARAAVMVFDDPSLPGGFTTLIHAMFLRTPFIVSECLGVREHVIDGETGFVTPHDDSDALGEAVERLMQDAELARQFSRSAHDRARQRHSLEAAADAFFKLTVDVLRGG